MISLRCFRYYRLSLYDARRFTLRNRVVDRGSEGIDLAIRVGTLDDYPDLVERRLGEPRLIICAYPKYLNRRGTPSINVRNA